MSVGTDPFLLCVSLFLFLSLSQVPAYLVVQTVFDNVPFLLGRVSTDESFVWRFALFFLGVRTLSYCNVLLFSCH